jgi:hypothetical protein
VHARTSTNVFLMLTVCAASGVHCGSAPGQAAPLDAGVSPPDSDGSGGPELQDATTPSEVGSSGETGLPDTGAGPDVDAGCAAAAALEMGRAQRIATIKANLNALAMAPYTPQGGNQLRHATERAHVILVTGGSAAQAESLVKYAFSQIQPSGAVLGSTDANTIVFTMAPVGPILLRYGKQLSAAFLQSVPAGVASGVAGLRAYAVGTSYTNIYLLKATSLLLLGEAVADAAMEKEGLDALGAWLTYTKTDRAGIEEYDSPDYTGVQTNALQGAYANTTSAAAKALLGQILDYYWYDVAANYFSPHATLSGPHSRDYDVLFADNLDPNYYAEGLGGDSTRAGVEDPGRYAVPLLEGDYLPPACALSLSQLPERIVRSRFGPGTAATRFNHPGMDRYNYVTSDFAIGSTGAFAGTGQERLIGAEFSTTKSLTVVGVNFADNPFIRGTSGFAVNPKVGATFTSVQDHGDVLAMYDLQGQANMGNVLVPLGVDATTIDGKLVAISGQLLTTQSVVALREANAAVAIRVLGYTGVAPTLEAGTMGAGRVAMPSQRAVFLIRAAHVDDTTFPGFVSSTAAASATITGMNGTGPWQVSLGLGSLTLEAGLDPQPTGRKVNGVDATPNETLSVNGVDCTGILP